MQDFTATMMHLQALQEIRDGLHAVRDELHRLNERLAQPVEKTEAPRPARPVKFPRPLPR